VLRPSSAGGEIRGPAIVTGITTWTTNGNVKERRASIPAEKKRLALIKKEKRDRQSEEEKKKKMGVVFHNFLRHMEGREKRFRFHQKMNLGRRKREGSRFGPVP